MALPIVVLISGTGSNLQAIIDAQASGALNVDIRAVISNRPGVAGLERAERAGIPARVLDHTGFASREDFDKALMELIDGYRPSLVVLAGFMRILSDEFADHYARRMLNIHPSLLPEFRGLNTHQRALDAGRRRHGASVHFVTSELDGGPLIVQGVVTVADDDTAQTLAAKVQRCEHQIYPLAIGWFASGALVVNNDHLLIDGELAPKVVLQ
ncbi:MAG: phosphoribosylglycinamide formyltransferase [Gammaproteobacteria bacterium]|nr:phosphoribosylglycinamide formyltransferase [Gammaproteobacteria bacterium]